MIPFDIYWADVFYEEDSNKYKVRPVIIYDNTSVIVIQLTSHAPRNPDDYNIRDWQQAGLIKQSTARLSKIYKLNKNMILNKIGHLSKYDIVQIMNKLDEGDFLNNIITEKLEIHDTLNPKIWNNDKTLRSDVKIALYDIIDEFINNSNFLTKDDIITANIVGSNASYNYTDFSDLDLHLVVDFDELSSDGKFVGYASDSERVIFNRRYDIDINGVNAEIYVEDIKSLPVSNGIYDLYKETWIKQPVKLKAPEIDNNLYNNIYNKTKSEALKLLDTASSAKSIKDFINKLYIDRRNSLAKDGEVGIYNQVFKDIRNEGILDNLKDLYYELRSEELSIDNDDTQLENILRQTAFGHNY